MLTDTELIHAIAKNKNLENLEKEFYTKVGMQGNKYRDKTEGNHRFNKRKL